MRDFTKLEVWQKSREFIREVFRLTSGFDSLDRFGIGSQLRRAANSIGANIAEGMGRPTGVDRRRLLSIALASANEVEHHLTVVSDTRLAESARIDQMLDEVRQIRMMLVALRRSIAES